MAKTPTTDTDKGGAKPKYQVLEKCYLPVEDHHGVVMERVLDPLTMPYKTLQDGTQLDERVPLIITYTGTPAHYLKPMNDAARKQCEQHPERMAFQDPIHRLTAINANPPAA